MTTTARVLLTAEDKVSAVLKSVGGEFDRFAGVTGKVSTVLAALGGGAMLAFAGNAIKAAAGLDDLAEQTGASVEELSKLEQVAILSDTAMSDVAATSVKLSKALSEGVDPASATAKALGAIGLSAKELRGLDPAAQMQRVAVALDQYRDGAGKTALAVALLGRSGAQMLPYLKDLAEAGELNATTTDEQAAAADRYVKQSRQLNLELNRMGRIIAVESIPVLTALKETGLDVGKALLGLSGESDRLAERNAIKEWAETGGRAIAFMGDAIDGVRRFMSVSADSFESWMRARNAIFKGNFEEALSIYKEMRQRSEATLMAPTILDRFTKNLATIRSEAEKTGKTIRKDLNFDTGDGSKARQTEYISDARKALAAYVDELQREADKLEDITAKERILRTLRANPEIDTAQVREMLALQEQIVDLRRRDAAARKEDQKSQADGMAQMKALEEELIGFTDRANDARKIALTARFEALMRDGWVFTDEEKIRIVKGIADIGEEANKTAASIEDLGLIFTSALGEFIKDPGSGNFFKALTEDVLQFTTKLLILDPILKMIKASVDANTSGGSTDILGFLGSLGSSIVGSFGGARAAGGPVYAGKGYLVGENGPEWFAPRQSGNIVPNGAGMGGSTTFNFNVAGSIDPRSAQQIAAAVAREQNLANRRLN